MAIDNIVFHNIGGIVDLHNFNDTLAVKLRVRDAGKYVIWGKVVIANSDGSSQNASARLTTLDGVTELDRTDVRIDKISDANKQCLYLQATMVLPDKSANDVIDIRCATFSGNAQESSLFAMLVDGLSPSL